VSFIGKILGISLVLFAFGCHEVAAQNIAGTRDQLEKLFELEIAPRASISSLKLAMALEVLKDHKRYIGNIHQPFASGDQLRFHFLVNEDAYIYLLLLKGSRGTSCILFPLAETGLDNFFARGQVAIVPRAGALEFDKVTGYEEVGIICSKEKLDPLQFLGEPSRLSLRKRVVFPANAQCIEGSGRGLRILPSVLPLGSSPFQDAATLIHDPCSILLAASGQKAEKRKFTLLRKSVTASRATSPVAVSKADSTVQAGSSVVFYRLKILHQ
jgi:hypothetical protein